MLDIVHVEVTHEQTRGKLVATVSSVYCPAAIRIRSTFDMLLVDIVHFVMDEVCVLAKIPALIGNDHCSLEFPNGHVKL